MADIRPHLKGILVLPDGMPVPFLYNPAEITERRSVQYATKNPVGFSHPVNHYMHGENTEITFEMSIRSRINVGGRIIKFPLELYIQALYDLTYPIRLGGIMVDAPPVLTFVFSAMIRKCRITTVEVIRKQFDQYLFCKWARVRISMFEVVTKNKNRKNSVKTGLGVLKSLGGLLGKI